MKGVCGVIRPGHNRTPWTGFASEREGHRLAYRNIRTQVQIDAW